MRLWAKIDAISGEIRSHGVCAADDMARQQVPFDQTIVKRPNHVTCNEPWRYVDGAWVKDES